MTGSASGTGAGGPAHRPVANPVTIAPTLDPGSATSAVVGSTGGTLAVARGGISYSLKIPAGALALATKITMTALASASGVPTTAGVVAGVQLAPEGLRLLSLGTLTVQGVPDPANVMGFGYFGAGADFYLQSPYVQGAAISIPISHFSGDGLTRATPAEVQAQLQRPPASDEAQAEQQAAADRLNGDIGALNNTRRAYYNDELRPTLIDATTNAAALPEFAKAFAWEQKIALDGQAAAFSTEQAEINSLLVKALQNAFNAAYQTCVDKHDVMQIQTMLAYARELSLIGSADQPFDLTKVEACMHFTLQADISVTEVAANAGISSTESFHVTASVPLTWSVAENRISGKGPLTWAGYTYTAHAGICQSTASASPSGGELTSDRTDLQLDSADPAKAVVNDVLLFLQLDNITPGKQLETCAGIADPVTGPAGTDIAGMFARAHPGGALVGTTTVVVAGFDIVGGSTYATRTIDVTTAVAGGGTITEHTTLTLLHTPGAMP